MVTIWRFSLLLLLTARLVWEFVSESYLSIHLGAVAFVRAAGCQSMLFEQSRNIAPLLPFVCWTHSRLQCLTNFGRKRCAAIAFNQMELGRCRRSLGYAQAEKAGGFARGLG